VGIGAEVERGIDERRPALIWRRRSARPQEVYQYHRSSEETEEGNEEPARLGKRCSRAGRGGGRTATKEKSGGNSGALRLAPIGHGWPRRDDGNVIPTTRRDDSKYSQRKREIGHRETKCEPPGVHVCMDWSVAGGR
jgi:hypothetical protein